MLTRYVLKRIVILIPVLIGISVVLFWIAKIMPGDQVRLMLPQNIRPEVYQQAYDAMSARLGLDRPIVEQYFRWIHNFLFLGNFGISSIFNRPVVDVIAEPLTNTIILNLCVNFVYLLVALPVGIRMAVKRGSFFDNGWQVFSLAAFSIPSFSLRSRLYSSFL